jgi:hypothetical protein
MANPTPTSGKEWRKRMQEGGLVTLPSGFVAHLRPVVLTELVATGDISNPLVPIIANFINGNTALTDVSEVNTIELLQKSRSLAFAIASAVFVNPRVVENPVADDEIGLSELTEEDRNFLIDFAVQPFRYINISS